MSSENHQIYSTIMSFVDNLLVSYMENLKDEHDINLLNKVRKRFQKDDVMQALTSEIEPHMDKKKNKKKKKKKIKDDNKPKRNVSAYIFFCKEHRVVIKENNPGLTPKEITHKLGVQWNAVKNTLEVEKYNKMADDDKQRYMKEIESYTPPVTEDVTPPKKKTKKPKSAYQFFLIEARPIAKHKNPTFTLSEIRTEISNMWNTIKHSSKNGDEEAIKLMNKYNNLATEARTQYYRDLENEGKTLINIDSVEEPAVEKAVVEEAVVEEPVVEKAVVEEPVVEEPVVEKAKKTRKTKKDDSDKPKKTKKTKKDDSDKPKKTKKTKKTRKTKKDDSDKLTETKKTKDDSDKPKRICDMEPDELINELFN